MKPFQKLDLHSASHPNPERGDFKLGLAPIPGYAFTSNQYNGLSQEFWLVLIWHIYIFSPLTILPIEKKGPWYLPEIAYMCPWSPNVI